MQLTYESTKPCKVLVVEDEGLIAHDITRRLEALGHEVVGTASTAEEAIGMAAGVDLVLLDIRIDGPIDGIEAAAQIRDRFHVPVIFLTALTDRVTIERAKLAGPFGYLVKPLAHSSLNPSIEIALYKHRMERAVEEREAWLATTLSSVADAVIVTGSEGRVRMLNRAAEALTGWTEGEAAGQHISKIMRLLDADSGEDAEDAIPLAILRDATVPLERNCQLVSRSGRQVMIEGAVAPVKMPGAALGAVLTFRDVSARRWEEHQLRQAQKVEAASRLAACVATSYSDLLATIRTRTEQFSRQFGEYSPARQAVDEIQHAADAAEKITRQLTSFGMRQASQPEVLSLNGVLRRLSKLIESVAGGRIEAAIRPSPGAGKIKIDTAQLEQVIMNLVLHSCAVMPDGGQILIETGNTELPIRGGMSKFVTLVISHTGQEPYIDRLFEPLSFTDQAGSIQSGKDGGDGLALAIVHGIVSEHGGYISARPGTEGGCRIEALFPCVAETETLPRFAGRVPTILLIDYRDGVRSQLHNFFEANGFNLVEASDADEAIALGELHDGTIDLLVAETPTDGLIAALQRAHRDLHVLRIVDGQESGANELHRPFTQRALLDRVSELLTPSLKLESASAG